MSCSQDKFENIILMPCFSATTEPKLNKTQKQKVHNLYKLVKMKKQLAIQQLKVANRIRLFKKASQKEVKKRQQSHKIFQRIQNIKCAVRIKNKSTRMKTSHAQRKNSLHPAEQQGNQENQNHHKLVQQLQEEKLAKARALKQEKQRNKVIIMERKKMDLGRKLQSANMIRRRRGNAKIAKQQYENEKKQQVQRSLLEKYENQKHEIVELEKHINELQFEEHEQFEKWKKTVDTPTSL